MDELAMSVDALMSGHNLGFGINSPRSKGFLALLHDIGAAKTKHGEDKILRKELLSLKEYVGSSKLSAEQIRELLLRLIYCEMLGQDASFGYINAIKHAEQSAILEKKTGYLAASIFLNRDHDLVCLLINTIQKDLKSTNVVAKCTVLNVICTLVDAEKIPPLLPFIAAALRDKRVEVRKKALITLKHVYQLSASLVADIDEQLRAAISDRDPSVVSAALQFFHTLVKKNPSKYQGYLKVFLKVLMQIVDGKLSEYNFHGVQAPWIQIKLLNILALLGHQNKSCSESMSTTLQSMMRSLPTDCNIGCAVMFECIRTSTAIYPLKPLLDLAAKKTTLFLTSNTSNLKCLGITAMTALVEVDTNYAGDEKLQQVIIKCLDDDDKTIGKKILELLYKITNSENISVICERLLDYIRCASEQSIKIDVAKNLGLLANQYAPNTTWYVDTINDVIQAADNFIQDDVMHNLCKVIAAGESEDQRVIAAKYLELIKITTMDDSIVQIACWVLGEYGNLIQDVYSVDVVLSLLTALLDRKFEDATTYGWILTALAKLTRHLGVYLPETSSIMDRYRSGFSAELRQRGHEINVLARDMALMKSVFPLSSTEEDAKVCSSLSFLDNYVANALTAGAQPYRQNLSNIQETPDRRKAQELRFKPYDDPFCQQASLEKETPENVNNKVSSAVPLSQNTTSNQEEKFLPARKEPLSTSRPVWGPSGYTGNKIRMTSDGSPKIVQSSSGKSSSGGVENHRKERVKTTENVEETNLPFKGNMTIVDRSPNVGLFAGIKSKPKFVSSSKAKASTQDNSQEVVGQTTSGGSPSTSSEASQEQVTLKKLDFEQLVEDRVGTTNNEEQGCDSNESGSVKELNDIENTPRSNYEPDLLLDVVGNDSSEGTLQPITVASLAQLNTGLHVEDKGQTPNDNDAVSSILDTDITETDVFVEQNSFTTNSESIPPTDHEHKELCIDSNIRLVTCTVHEPSELVLLMKLTNHNQNRVAIKGISLKIEPPSNLIVDTSRTEITVEELSFLETITKDVSMKYQYPSTRMSFKGTLRYSTSQNSKLLHFEQELPARHLFRPLKMTTEQFGKKWTSMSCDIRKRVSVRSRRSCEQVLSSFAKFIHFEVADIKGKEGIVAGSILGSGVCLLHVNVSITDIELWVKSSNKKLSEMIMKECLLACDQLNKS